MFTLLDIPMWLIMILVAILCVIFGIKGKAKDKTAAKIICFATGLVFLSGIPLTILVRSQTTKPDYKTTQGVSVKNGAHNQCLLGNTEKWIGEVITSLSKIYDPVCTKKSLDGVLLICVDEEKLSAFGRYMRGYTWGKYCVAGYKEGAPAYTEKLVKHELSHQVVMKCNKNGAALSEEDQHKLFAEKKLGF